MTLFSKLSLFGFLIGIIGRQAYVGYSASIFNEIRDESLPSAQVENDTENSAPSEEPDLKKQNLLPAGSKISSLLELSAKTIASHLRKESESEREEALDSLSKGEADLGHLRSWIEKGLSCPEGYVHVPGNPDFATPRFGDDFCVMKYLASEETSSAISRMKGSPWRLTQNEAKKACEQLGPGYHLITNPEWMTVARNVEITPDNWNFGKGPAGTGLIPTGRESGFSLLAPASEDTDPYFATGFINDWIHKRTLVLNSGEVIWDLTDKVGQWVDIAEPEFADIPGAVEKCRFGFDFIEAKPSRHFWAPLNEYSWNQEIGYFSIRTRNIPGNPETLLRGRSGIYGTDLSDNSTDRDEYSFRCAYTPFY